MSDAREQSYYEIALTNRQVMSIFIVLLVCLLAAFVSGVWIGRQGAGVRVQTADAQRIEGEGDAAAPLGEMDFFSRRGGAAGSGDPAVDSAGRAAAAPVNDPPSPPPSDPPAPVAEPRPEPPPRRDPTPAPGAAAQAPVRSAPPAAAAASSEFLYIQVFSGVDREQAQSIVEKLRAGGYAAFLSSVEVESRLMHRVRIGPYSERAEAEVVAGKVQREHKLSTWITR